MGQMIELTASDGHTLGAYRADPAGAPRAGVVVIQEIFGVNAHIREVADDYAAQGYLAIAPALFDRSRPGVELGYDENAIAEGRDLAFAMDPDVPVRDLEAAVAAAASAGKVGVVGYCWGGSLTFMAACKLDVAVADLRSEFRSEIAELRGELRSEIGNLRGEIKGLWIVATNTAHSWINQGQARDILGRLDCLVVQDMYASTETARMADVVLPAAAWGEKDGTFINSERRIGTIRKVARPPGRALPDFAIFKLVAEYWGCGELFREWESPAAVFRILKRLSAGQPCDITGIAGYDALEAQGGIQWPCPAGGPPPPPRSERRLFEDGRFYHPDCRARLLFETPRPFPEPATDRFPLLLLTGRGSAAQWHTQTRTSKSAILRKLYPARIYVEVNPDDAKARGIGANDSVHVESRRGRIAARAFVTHSVQRGHVFIPMHYEATNRLTDAVFDPYSKQPSYKACAVELHAAAAGA